MLQRAVDEFGVQIGADVQPTAASITRWPGAFPQYRPHHFERVAEIERGLPSGLFLAGASYRGIGIPACIADGRRAAMAELGLPKFRAERVQPLGPLGLVHADLQPTNVLIARDISGNLNNIEELVRSLDTQTPQVLVEARIVEATSRYLRDIGIQWGGGLFFSQRGGNPIFYVSSSPWNLYDLLHEVFEVHGIPAGPLFLKDDGIAKEVLLSLGHREHKLRSIEHILQTHQDLPFVLVGDSGQKDPEIYREVAERFPGRIRAIYIREVAESQVRDAELHALQRELEAMGVPLVLAGDTVTAARHAASLDLIDELALGDIASEKRREEGRPSPLESAVRK